MSITSQNAKQIRAPMEVYCGMTAALEIDLTITKSGENVYADSNISEALQNDWTLLDVASFDDGVYLDGSQVMFADHTASATGGKYGVVVKNGAVATIEISASQTIPAVALQFPKGSGTVEYTYDGETHTTEIRSVITVPVDATSASIVITATSKTVLSMLTPGALFEWANDDLISVKLDLRSDLSIYNPSFELSSIEIRAYYPEDLSQIIQVFGEGVPIWYYAGYDGDYSETRFFYLSEPAIQENGVITIQGVDAASLLDSVHVETQGLQTSERNAERRIYRWLVRQIENAGITVKAEEEPELNPNVEDNWTGIVFLDGSAREHIANIMAYGRASGWYPRYVDAGIPTVAWSTPTTKWQIKEADCGEVVKRCDRIINRITTDSDYGVDTLVVFQDDRETIQTGVKVRANKRTTLNFSDSWWWSYTIPNVKSYVWKNLDSVQWISDTTGEVTVKGREVTYDVVYKSVRPQTYGLQKRNGYKQEVSILALGEPTGGLQVPLLPNWAWTFARSPKGGSFRWKGDPRMQPRDVFVFRTKNGSDTLCTIESIQLTHEGGGTYADITYREGVV